jgi:hypothetical protein
MKQIFREKGKRHFCFNPKTDQGFFWPQVNMFELTNKQVRKNISRIQIPITVLRSRSIFKFILFIEPKYCKHIIDHTIFIIFF